MSGLAESIEVVDENFVKSGGRRLLYFGGCDYLRMAWHPEVRETQESGAGEGGLSVGASRITTGNRPVYECLEKRLAGYFGASAGLTVSAGYLANLAVTQALAGTVTHAFIDERAHASLVDALRFLDCPVVGFGHKDLEDLARKLGQAPRQAKPLIATDGLFGHDGSVAPLKAYDALLPKGGTMLVDDAHGAGVLGARGRGALEVEGVARRRIVQTISFSKAFGVTGGGVLCAPALRDRIVERSRAFQGSTPMPPALAAAALKSLSLVKRDKARRLRLAMNTHLARTQLADAGLPVSRAGGPILEFVPGAGGRARRVADHLGKKGVYPSLIRYPGGSRDGWFRFAISSEHSHEQIRTLTDALREAW